MNDVVVMTEDWQGLTKGDVCVIVGHAPVGHFEWYDKEVERVWYGTRHWVNEHSYIRITDTVLINLLSCLNG